jgi:hypothetical protein
MVDVRDDRDIANILSYFHHVLHIAFWRNKHNNRVRRACQEGKKR